MERRDFICVIHLILKMIKWETCFHDLFFRCQNEGFKMQSKRSSSSPFPPLPHPGAPTAQGAWSASSILLLSPILTPATRLTGEEGTMTQESSSPQRLCIAPRGNWDEKKICLFHEYFKICNKYLIFHCTVRNKHGLVILSNLPINAFSSPKEPPAF